MKYILLICDGMSDIRGSRGMTPLEFAEKPNFDSICRLGKSGIMDVVKKGVAPGSDTGHLSLFGYDLKKHYPGRGPLEAIGAGLELEEGDVAFRANIATVDKKFNVIDRRAGRITGDLSELEKAVNEIDIGIPIEFRHTIDHRGTLVLRGANSLVTDTDPHKENVKVLKSKPARTAQGAKRIANIVNNFTKKCYAKLSRLELNKGRRLPANMILLRGAGLYKSVPSFYEMHNLKGAAIATVALVKGVAKFCGLDVLDVEGATGGANTNIHGKFQTAVDSLEKYDFVVVNVKATDNFGHDGNFEGKVQMIEKIDAELGIFKGILDECVIVLTADHSTPVEKKEHTADPVPVCIAGNGIKPDLVKTFNEYECAKGGLKRIKGIELIPLLKKFG